MSRSFSPKKYIRVSTTSSLQNSFKQITFYGREIDLSTLSKETTLEEIKASFISYQNTLSRTLQLTPNLLKGEKLIEIKHFSALLLYLLLEHTHIYFTPKAFNVQGDMSQINKVTFENSKETFKQFKKVIALHHVTISFT